MGEKEWHEMNELKGIKWHESWKKWNECIEVNELTWMTWYERIGQSGPKKITFLMFSMWNRALATVSCTFCRPHLPKVLGNPQLLMILCDELLDDDLVDIWHRALASVSCTFCRPHVPKAWHVQRPFLHRFLRWLSARQLQPSITGMLISMSRVC